MREDKELLAVFGMKKQKLLNPRFILLFLDLRTPSIFVAEIENITDFHAEWYRIDKEMSRKRFRTIAAFCLITFGCLSPAMGQLTLDDCQRLAKENYPLIKRYDLIRATIHYTVSNLTKGYFPQLSFGGQASWQSDVMTLPDALRDMMAATGYEVKGLKKDQYKVTVDVNQVIYDGGSIQAAKRVAQADGEVQQKQNEVDLYAVRKRVNNLYFGVMLMEDQLRLNETLQQLLLDNCRKLETLQQGGTVLQADVEVMRAEWLQAKQQQTELASAKESYRQMLALFVGQVVELPLAKPSLDALSSYEVMRPELSLMDAQVRRYEEQMKQLNANIRPRLSLFAQGYYGYPGYNMFEDMFAHDWSWNGMVGVRLSWNLGSFYTHKNDKRKLAVAINQVENAREVFLFNNRLQSTEERQAIERYQKLLKEDEEIIRLRTFVRQSAETKLEHGVIDVNDLLQEITREYQAQIAYSTHELEMLKQLYELKHTLNQ